MNPTHSPLTGLPGYYRYPTIAGDTVVFVSEDDLWTVSRHGGTARRLTAGWGSATRPWLSPDGRSIAFIGREEGDSEVYVMAAAGGEVRRLTYLGATTQIAGWDPAGRIVFATNHGQPFPKWFALHAISPTGGEPELLPYGPSLAIAFGPRQGVVVGRNTADPARWKRYRGGTRGVLWIDPGTGRFHRYARDDGNIASPMWIGERIFFLSDHEGVGNLYSITPAGKDIRRHTDHHPFYARNACTDGQRVVYHAAGDLYLFDPATETGGRIAVDYFSQRTQREKKYVAPGRFMTEYAPSPDGSRLAVTTRGKPYLLGNWEGPVEPIGVADGVRYRMSQWLPDGTGIVTVSDESGEERVELRRRENPPATMAADVGRVLDLKISPDGQFAALGNHRFELWLLDLTTLSGRVIDRSAAGPIRGLDWSPDSRWIAYGFHLTESTSTINLYHLPTASSQPATDPVSIDSDPVFDPSGQYLYFLSYRTFDPVYDSLKFDLGFLSGEKPHVIVLSRETPSPFMPQPDTKAPELNPDKPEIPDVEIDLEDIAGRVLAFPVAEGRYRQLAAGYGKVYWTTVPPEGGLSTSFYPKAPSAKATLSMFDFKDQKVEALHTHVTSFALSHDRKWLAIRIGNRLRVVKAGEKIEEKAEQPGRQSGLVDLDRLVVAVNPPLEWAQMTREAWRLMRDNFWTADMSGLDWNATLERYLTILPRVGTRSEFSDFMWELQGELGTSHAYEMGGDYRKEPENRMGLLGADLTWDQAEAGYRVRHLVAGDSWNPGEHSPLLAPGVNLSPGDIITAVDGQRLGPDLPPSAWLIGKAKRDVRLTFRQASGSRRTAVIRPLEQETAARYREWVNQNRRQVTQASDGRVGYVHIPDMGPRGFAEFYRGYLSEFQKEALIVDVRFNGGGHVSQLILDKLMRRRIGYDLPRHGQPAPYPGDSVIGPIVALTNEQAGSDGDIFSHAFKLMAVGPLVGTRTWGGVIGISVRHALVDGSITTQPEFSFWFKDTGWGVENYGTDPDIEVENSPEDYARGFDRQLHETIRIILAALESSPPRLPDFDSRPSRAIPRLPERMG
ncbi:MAG: PDZ domain-containing protein [Thermaerobacter sp.]|nr:PDZ domain-containing protein [Thermaerobacter sp.]